MKKLKKMMALVIAMVMCLSMALPAMADDTTGAPTSGTITINSPIVGATYKVYKIFDMTTNATVDAFSYTIDENSKFYGAVANYAKDKSKGLALTRIQGMTPATYNVSAATTDSPIDGYGTFDAQAFGKAMQAVLAEGSPEVTADAAETEKAGTGIVAKAAASAAISEDYTQDCTITTVNNSDQLVFDGTNHAGIPLGYFLINPTYPKAAAKTATLGTDEAGNKQTFTAADVVKDAAGVATGLTADATAKVTAYVNATVTTEYVSKYIEDHSITRNTDGSPLNADGRDAITTALKNSMTEDAVKQILAVFNNENGEESDINVKEPILVFLDSSKPDAIINEKNELDKWDVPVNPTGDAPEGTPDHGEPEGGKNIVVAEGENGNAYYADWSEAKIGDSVHYQLRVNAMNFIRTGETDATVEQVKEYILADFQSAHMHFDEAKGLHVSIWQGDNDNDSQAASKENVTSNVLTGIDKATYEATGSVAGASYPSINYTEYAKGTVANTFFKNATGADGTTATTTDIFGTTETGIVVPWITVYDPSTVADDPATPQNESEVALAAKIAQYPIYDITNVPTGNVKTETVKKDANNQLVPFKIQDATDPTIWQDVQGVYISTDNHAVDENGQVIDTDANGNLKTENGAFVYIQETKPVYTFSLYSSDVTIVVDYWMILDKDAIVDEPGNKNFAQYGWNPVDTDQTTGVPKTPDDDDKPSQKEEVDEATVYTFAIAWVKTDEQGNELADAEFELPFYVLKDQKDGNAYVYGVSKEEYAALGETDKAKYTNLVTTTTTGAGEKGVITIKGVKQDVYTITETKAPAGYNKLAAPFKVEAKKSGVGVTTKTKTTIFLDAQGNVTDKVTTSTKEYETDVDSFNTENATSPEELSVPVYQFDPVVNRQGSELPATGGMGTTLFYAIGAILVLGAGILLVTKRRMSAK